MGLINNTQKGGLIDEPATVEITLGGPGIDDDGILADSTDGCIVIFILLLFASILEERLSLHQNYQSKLQKMKTDLKAVNKRPKQLKSCS